MGNEDMKEKCNKKPKVRQYANMGVLCDNKMLAVKERKDHRHCDCGCIVKKMDYGIGEEDGLFHFCLYTYLAKRSLKKIISCEYIIVQFLCRIVHFLDAASTAR